MKSPGNFVDSNLREAAEGGEPWHVLARIARDRLIGVSGRHQRSFWSTAPANAGLSTIMVRRYVSALVRIEEIAKQAGLPTAALLAKPFGSTELALRLHERDPAAGLEALRALKARRMTLSTLRAKLEEMPEPQTDLAASRGASIRERGRMVGRCEELVAAEAERLFGPGTVLARRPSVRYLRRVGFEFKDSSGGLLGGGDLYLAEAPGGGRDSLEPIAQSVLIASYLPAFYVVLGPDLGEQDAERAAATLEILEAHSVGVLLLHAHAPSSVVRRPQAGLRPDRTDQYNKLLKLFAGRAPLRPTE